MRMKEKEVSSILVGQDGEYFEGQDYYDAFFIIFTVDEIINKGSSESIDSWLEIMRNKYETIYY